MKCTLRCTFGERFVNMYEEADFDNLLIQKE